MVLTIDLETTNLDPFHTEILLIAYRVDGGEIKQIKVYEGEKPNERFLELLSSYFVVKRGHNTRFDLLCLVAAGYVVNGPIDDTRILAYLENPQQELGLKSLAERKLFGPVTRLEDFGKARIKKAEKALYPVRCGKVWVAKDPLETYNKRDVLITDELRKELVETEWYRIVEQPLSKVLFDMEARGIQLDIPYLTELQNEFQETSKTLREGLSQNGDFNPNSPIQVKKEFEKQGVLLASTDKYQLKQLSWAGNELATRLLGYRRIAKLLSTYVSPLINQSDNRGRIHGRFNQAGRESLLAGDVGGTATGRLSSSDPNLQNIPDRTVEGRKVRAGFIATPGMILIDSDLKQIEPRLVAHYSQSKVLLDAYSKGLDTHAIMGGLIFNKQPDSLTKLERFIGKTSWLATVYGCGYKKLKQIVEVNSDEPVYYDEEFYKKVQEAFWQANPEIRSWRYRTLGSAKAAGSIATYGGRTIKIPAINSRDKWEAILAERMAINYIIQGSAADIMKLILVSMGKSLDAELLATVHDEVLIEHIDVDRQYNDNILKDINEHMHNTVKLKNVPIEADTKVIKNWGQK